MAGPLDWLQQILGANAPPSNIDQAPSDTGPAMLSYLRDVLSGKVAAGGMLQNNYDPNRSFSANALDPRGLEQAMGVAMGFGGGGLGIGAPKYALRPFGPPGEGMWRVQSPRGEDLGEIARYIETSPRSGKMQTSYGHSMQTDTPYFGSVDEAAMDLRRAYAEMLRQQRVPQKGLLD